MNLEERNTSVIFLHRKTGDWRAYEHSAFLLTYETDCPFRPHLWQHGDDDIALVSFPSAALASFLEKTAHAHIDENFIAISASRCFDKKDWRRWRRRLNY